MNFFELLVAIILADIFINFTSDWIAKLLEFRIKCCDLDFMNNYFLSLWTKLFIGCPMFGLIYLQFFNEETLKKRIVSAILGVTVYALIFIFTEVRKYNNLREQLQILNIDTNEKLEQLITKHKEG